jgi:hypothetical protein
VSALAARSAPYCAPDTRTEISPDSMITSSDVPDASEPTIARMLSVKALAAAALGVVVDLAPASRREIDRVSRRR